MCFRPSEASTSNICPACGANNTPERTECAYCGEPLEKATDTEAPAPQSPQAPSPAAAAPQAPAPKAPALQGNMHKVNTSDKPAS